MNTTIDFEALREEQEALFDLIGYLQQGEGSDESSPRD